MRISIILFFLLAVISLHGQDRFISSASLSYGSYEAAGKIATEVRIGVLSQETLALGLQAAYTHPTDEIEDVRMLLLGPFATYYFRGDTFRPFFGAEVMYGDYVEDIMRYNLYPTGLLRYGPYIGGNFFLLPQLAVEASVKYQFLAQKSRDLLFLLEVPNAFSVHIGVSFFY